MCACVCVGDTRGEGEIHALVAHVATWVVWRVNRRKNDKKSFSGKAAEKSLEACVEWEGRNTGLSSKEIGLEKWKI